MSVDELVIVDEMGSHPSIDHSNIKFWYKVPGEQSARLITKEQHDALSWEEIETYNKVVKETK